MSFEQVATTVNGWSTTVEALAAVGAELSLRQSGASAPPEVRAALQRVTAAAGLGDLDELTPQQSGMLLALIRLFLHQAADLLAEPDRGAGWTYTDPVILDGWGRGSAMVPAALRGVAPELAEVGSFLDVGTGVGLLAVAAAGVWPQARIVGLDRWEPSLERARANVAAAGLGERIELRRQDLGALDDVDAYDCAWVPTFFFTERALVDALPRVLRATRPGGWVVAGHFTGAPDPLVAAVTTLRTLRGGGVEIPAQRGVELLEQAGCTEVRTARPGAPMPMEFVLGRRV